MSNGVGVIVAGDKSTLPGEPNILRILPSGAYKAKLVPSTLKNNVMMMLPLESEIDGIPLMPNQFVTKTCLTTYTYMTTYIHDGRPKTESREKVISNIATEDRNSIIKIIPTATIPGITLTQTPNLSVAEFRTTYTYLNTILDGELPLVVTSKHTVTNTITAPEDYLSLLQPSELATPVYDTNTYYSTISLTKTLEEDDITKVMSITDVITQVVVTKSLPARGTTASVMTSYYALDVEDPLLKEADFKLLTTDVVKTFFVTYTYYNTFLDNGSTVIKTNVSTASDIVTEKLYLHPKMTAPASLTSTPVLKQNVASNSFNTENLHIYATKTYLTTFTYFTTLLQDSLNNNKNEKSSTVINSHTRVMENIVTESVPNSLFANKSIEKFQTALLEQSNSRAMFTTLATLLDGQSIEITAINVIKPTKSIDVRNPIESTQLYLKEYHLNEIDNLPADSNKISVSYPIESSASNAVETDQTKVEFSVQKEKSKPFQTNTPNEMPLNIKNIPATNVNNKLDKIEAKVPDLLSSFNINRLSAFGPVINAMAGLIQNNFGSSNRENDTKKLKTAHPPISAALTNFNEIISPAIDSQSRSPMYIPVRGATEDSIEEAESQVMERLNYNSHALPMSGNWNEFHGQKHKDQLLIGKLTHESPLLNGGIPISPGEIITTNSDVIIGKQSVNGPRGPYHSKFQNNNNNNNLKNNNFNGNNNYNLKENLNIPIEIVNPKQDLKPKDGVFYRLPARSTSPLHSDQFPQPTINQGSHINENYIGPPPPLGIPQPNNRQTLSGQHSRYKQSPVLVGQRQKNSQQNQLRENQFSRPPIFFNGNKQQLDQQQSSNHYNLQSQQQKQQHQKHQQQQPNLNRPPNNHQQPNQSGQQNKYKLNQHIFKQPNKNHNLHKNPNIFEIQRIPEVYSTDLPPMQIKNFVPPIDVHSDVIFKSPFFELPEVVESSTGQPLLVNIQPSQVANVIIPHGSTSALVFGGATEHHKVGQYFNDPSPYPVAQVGIKINGFGTFSNGVASLGYASISPSVVHENSHNQHEPNLIGINIGTLPNYSEHVNIKPHKPILTDQNVHSQIKVQEQAGQINFGNGKETTVLQHDQHIPQHQQYDYHLYHSQNSGQKQSYVPQTSFENPSLSYPHYIVSEVLNSNVKPPGIATLEHILKNNESSSLDLSLNRPHFNENNLNKQQPEIVNFDSGNSISYHQHGRPLLVNHNLINSLDQGQSINLQNVYTTPSSYSADHSPSEIRNHNHYYNIDSDAMNHRNKSNFQQHHNTAISESDDEIILANHTDEELESNDEREIVQETNQRPLIPGQVPIELLSKKPATSTTSKILFSSTTTEKSITEPLSSQTEYNDIKTNFPNKNISGNDKNGQSFVGLETSSSPLPLFTNMYATKPKNSFSSIGHRAPAILINNELLPPIKSNRPTPPFKIIDNTIYNSKQMPDRTRISPSLDVSLLQKQHSSNNVKISTQSGLLDNNFRFSFGQTEEPFDPKYTSSWPNKVTEIPTILDLAEKPINVDQVVINFNQTFERNNLTIHNRTIGRFELNTGEIVTTDNENGEIFDYKESTNPHNLGSIRESLNPNKNSIAEMKPPPFSINDLEIMKPPRAGGANSNNKLKNNSNNKDNYYYNHDIPTIKIQLPNKPQYPAESMKPPPVIDYPGKSHQTEEVMGLTPPLIARPHKIESSIQGIRQSQSTKTPLQRTSQPHRKYYQPTKPLTTQQSSSAPTTIPYLNVLRRQTTKKQQITRKKPIQLSVIDTATIDGNEEKQNNKYKDIYESYNAEENENNSEMQKNNSPDLKSSIEVPLNQPSKFNNIKIRRPYVNGEAEVDDIFILGSEQHIYGTTNKFIITSSTEKLQNKISSTQRKILDNIENGVNGKSNDMNLNTVHHAGNEIKIQDEDDISIVTKSKPSIDRNKVMLPTKYVTNTKTLTVTTTKTTVIKSQGTPPSTLTLTLTKTHTSHVVDTVTETHTLLKPTKLSGPLESPSSIVPTMPTSFIEPTSVLSNYPAFPVQATTILGSNQPILSFSDEDDSNLDEFIISYDEEPKQEHPLYIKKDPTITGDVIPVQNHHNYSLNENDSIFVVMTDQKQPGIIKINPSMIDTGAGISSHSETAFENEIYDLPNRDEDDVAKDVNHILLGGILIASPPRLDSPIKHVDCRPDCKAARNEVCQRVSNIMRCVCRPGFARMFPDRPCKPTYTYNMKLELAKNGKETLMYDASLADPTSPNYSHLAVVTHDSLDRTVMQSDLRDIYHGVHVTGFEGSGKAANGVLSNFYLQLSDNTDEKRLLDVFKKYLRANNYSLGGTELIAARPLIDLDVSDFDECLDQQFHDCSANAQCFNLRGTYTCSCKEGFADLSENPTYSGRVCSAEQLGCAQCHYHGTCYSRNKEDVLCECFQWYTGANCHLNLKLLLIGLVTLGAILFTLLLFCIMMTCVKKRNTKNRNRPMTVSILPHSSHHSTNSKKIDKKAMILDTSSETSEESANLPYLNKKTQKISQSSVYPTRKQSLDTRAATQHQIQLQQLQMQQQQIQLQMQQQKHNQTTQQAYNLDTMTMEQRDRSLTVMIPRARYHPAPMTNNAPNNMETFDHASLCSLATEAKLLNYLDASPPATKDHPKKKASLQSQSRNAGINRAGALVSAGYEVSAVSVGGSRHERDANLNSHKQGAHKISTISEKPQAFRQTDTQSIIRKSHSHGDLIDSMDDWLESMPHNDFGTVSEARSYDETTILAPTKLLRSLYDKQSSHMNIDEANTMAERDLGSTFLLPHTHLYKPDRGSDISGFDSL